MKTAAVLALFLASAAAFNAPFATRAVGKKAAPAKKAAKAAPESKGYPSFAEKAQAYSFGRTIYGGGDKVPEPVFIHPLLNPAPVPDFDYKEAAKARITPKNAAFTYDDGLTDLERKQRATIPAFLTGSAKQSSVNAGTRDDIVDQELPFGLDGDRFQLLFISVFGIFTLVGCLSGSIALD